MAISIVGGVFCIMSPVKNRVYASLSHKINEPRKPEIWPRWHLGVYKMQYSIYIGRQVLSSRALVEIDQCRPRPEPSIAKLHTD